MATLMYTILLLDTIQSQILMTRVTTVTNLPRMIPQRLIISVTLPKITLIFLEYIKQMMVSQMQVSLLKTPTR